MFFLDNYDKMKKMYLDAIGQTEKDVSSSKALFIKDMEVLKAIFNKLGTKNNIDKQDVGKLNNCYNTVYVIFNKVVKAKDMPENFKESFREERYRLTFLEAGEDVKFADAFAKTSEHVDANDISTISKLRANYMRHDRLGRLNDDRRNDIEDDMKFIDVLGAELDKNGKHIFGKPSKQFGELLKAFAMVKQQAACIAKEFASGIANEYISLNAYYTSMKKLGKAAVDYETHKGDYNSLKPREQMRVDISKKLQRFADIRTKAIDFMDSRYEMVSNMNSKAIHFEEMLKKQFSRMRHVEEAKQLERSREYEQPRVEKNIPALSM